MNNIIIDEYMGVYSLEQLKEFGDWAEIGANTERCTCLWCGSQKFTRHEDSSSYYLYIQCPNGHINTAIKERIVSIIEIAKSAEVRTSHRPVIPQFPKTSRDPYGVGARDYNTDNPSDVGCLFQTIIEGTGPGQILTFLADDGKVYYAGVSRSKGQKNKHSFCFTVRGGSAVNDFVVKGQSMRALIDEIIIQHGGNEIWGWAHEL